MMGRWWYRAQRAADRCAVRGAGNSIRQHWRACRIARAIRAAPNGPKCGRFLHGPEIACRRLGQSSASQCAPYRCHSHRDIAADVVERRAHLGGEPLVDRIRLGMYEAPCPRLQPAEAVPDRESLGKRQRDLAFVLGERAHLPKKATGASATVDMSNAKISGRRGTNALIEIGRGIIWADTTSTDVTIATGITEAGTTITAITITAATGITVAGAIGKLNGRQRCVPDACHRRRPLWR